MADYLAIDIGGTYIKSAFISDDNKLYDQKKVKTVENIDNALVNQLETIIDTAIQSNSIRAIGISTAGIVNREKGEIIYAGPTIKNYKGTALKAHLSEKFNLPIRVENDVNAALLGELWKGAARDQNNVYCITLGTGIGGAYYHHQLIDGFHHQANSVGYMLYEADSNTNFEMRASTSALNAMILREFGEDISAKAVFDLAKDGDEKSTLLIENWTREVAKGLAQIIILVDPKCIIIGGGISRQGGNLLEPIQKQIPQFLPDNFLKTEIKIAELYNDAALYGAVFPFKKIK